MTVSNYDVLMAKAHKTFLRNGGTMEDYLWCNASILTERDLIALDEEIENLSIYPEDADQLPLSYADCAEVIYFELCED